MQSNKSRKARHFTDRIDLFAQPVYQFSFKDSYVVSTGMGSLCTILMLLLLIVVVATKFVKFVEQDPDTFVVTDGLEFGYFPNEMQFQNHKIALGLSYRAEFQDRMTKEFTYALS